MWLWTLLACGAAPPPATDAPVPPPAAQLTSATTDLTAGAAWGAVFWREGQAWRVGGGDLLVGAEGVALGGATDERGPCGGQRAPGAPPKAALALPATVTTPPTLHRAPATPAPLLERAAWRLDEALPPRDEFSPATSAPDPALQRGVRVASLVKTRRHAAPPVLLASGGRECNAVIALLDAEAGAVLAVDSLPGACEPLPLLPPVDLDGDGALETAAWSEHRVLLYRLAESGAQLVLQRIGDWTCE